jgi:phage FluMu protein Com
MIKINCAICNKLLVEIEEGKVTYRGGFGIKCITCMEHDGADKIYNRHSKGGNVY